MCGLLGAFSGASRLDSFVFSTDDLDLMRHRGPDSQGWYVDPWCVMGFRRLAIIDRAGGQQPLYNEDESVVLTINGEIYNHRELRATLSARHRFRTMSDGETLLHLYEEKGLAFVEKVNGMFAFALHDRRANRVVLCRDRAGKKPLYYRFWQGKYLWSSEIRALTRMHLPPVDRSALADYLRFGYVPAPLTMLEGIYKIPAGHLVVLESGKPLVMKRYWSLEFAHDDWRDPGRARFAELKDELTARLDRAVGMRLESEVPIGFLLSGGIDSASVFASGTCQLGRDRALAFTIGFADEGIDESTRARDVVGHCGGRHAVLGLQQSKADALTEIISAVEEPVSTDALLPTNEVFSGIARTDVVTVLAGEGSDELFAGYPKFTYATPWAGARPYASALERYLAHEEFVFADESERMLLLGGDYDSGRFDDIEREAAELDPLSQMLLIETRLRLPDRINLRLDRLSMAYSIEARAPFMDFEFMEFCARIPHFFRITRSVDKYILREAMARRLPQSVLRSRKAPFHAPKSWFTASSVIGTVLDENSVAEAGLVEPDAVRMYMNLAADPGNHVAQEKVYSLCVLHLWFDCFYRTQAGASPAEVAGLHQHDRLGCAVSGQVQAP